MPVLGMLNTNTLEATERGKAWRLGIMDEFPNAAPLCNLMYRVGKEKVADPEFSWYERRFPTREMTVATGPGSGTTGDTDNVVVGTNEAYNVRAGDIVVHVTSMERARVTTTPSVHNTFTIIRNIGGSGAVSDWAASSKVWCFTNAQVEGSSLGTALTVAPTRKYNYLQIFRNFADTTKTLAAVKLRSTGDRFKDAQLSAQLMHEVDKEGALLFGIASEDLTGTTPLRTTAGLASFVTTNSYDASSGLTLSGWNNFLKGCFSANGSSDEKILVCGCDMLLALENMARAYSYAWADVGEQDSYGMELKKWKTSFGTVFVHEHKLLSKLSALRSWGFLVDPDQLVYRYLEGRDTDWSPNLQAPGDDKLVGHWLAEAGFEIHNEYTMGIVKGASTFAG